MQEVETNIAPAQEVTESAAEAKGGKGNAAPKAKYVHPGKQRTTGNKAFDWLVYPIIAFGAVFAWSAWWMHASKFGRYQEKYNGWVGGTAKFFKEGFIKDFPGLKGRSNEALHKKADNILSVLISFAAGTALVSPVKLFEDARDAISKRIDRLLGTTPANYDEFAPEPKQSWKSVWGGRTLTFGIVLTLANTVGKHIIHGAEETAKFLQGGAEKEWPNKFPQNPPGKGKLYEWAYVASFEAFYTALCTVSLYIISRSLARLFNKKEDQAKSAQAEKRVEETFAANSVAEPKARTMSEEEKPRKNWSKEREGQQDLPAVERMQNRREVGTDQAMMPG